MLTSNFFTGEWTVVILEACSCSKNDHDTVHLLSHWYKLNCQSYSVLCQLLVLSLAKYVASSWMLSCQFVTLEECICLKNDHDTINLVSHWYQLDCLLVRPVVVRITSTSGLIMGQICCQVLHDFSVNSGVILKKFIFAEVFCVTCPRGVQNILTEVRIKGSY